MEEDVIVIQSIDDHGQLQLRSGLQYSTQIIWNSWFSCRQIMEHLQHNTYRFNFWLEQIIIGRLDVVNMSPSEIVDGLPDVTILGEENGNDDEVLCAVCYEPFRSGETGKQLTCTHSFHSNCIFKWFTHKINCPICRNEQNSSRWSASVVLLYSFIHFCSI